MYDFKIEVVSLIINFSTELTTVVKFEVQVQNDADEAVSVVSLTSTLEDISMEEILQI